MNGKLLWVVVAAALLLSNNTRSDEVPLPAAEAGLTTPALDADFTVIGGSWSNPSTFVNGCGATAQYRFFNIDGSAADGSLSDRPCNETVIEIDPIYGNQALHVHAEPGNLQSLTYPTSVLNPLALGLGFPVSTYVEIEYRVDLAGLNQDGTPGDPIATWRPARGVDLNGNYDSFWLETGGHDTGNLNNIPPWTVGGGEIEWGGGPGPNCNDVGCYTGTVLWQADQSVYNREGFLVTSDGISNIWECHFWNDDNKGCRDLASATYPASIHPRLFQQHDNPVAITLGGYYYYNYDDGQWECCTADYVNPIDAWIARIRVFECFNWQAPLQCNERVPPAAARRK